MRNEVDMNVPRVLLITVINEEHTLTNNNKTQLLPECKAGH